MKGPTGFGDGRLVPFVDAIWTATTPVRFTGTWFPHVMTIVRLNERELLLHSPCYPSDELLAEIEGLGRVAHVVAPNWFHDLYLAEYRALYPGATFWAPTFLQRRRKSVIDCVLDERTRPPWFSHMPHIALSGLLTFDECIFFHRATKTLILADFLMNASADAQAPPFTRAGYMLFGLNGNLKVFPVLRWLALPFRASLQRTARSLLDWNPERLIVGHGVPMSSGVTEQLRNAVLWLRP